MLSELDLILRTKRLRERRAAARAATAAAEVKLAGEARARAQDQFSRHQAARHPREAVVYHSLLAAPVSARKLRADTALLSGLAAYAAVLDSQAEAAAAREEAARQQAARMRQDQARVARECEAAQAACDILLKLQEAASEVTAELESEDMPWRGALGG